MAVIQSEAAKRRIAIPYPQAAGAAVSVRYEMTVPATAVLNDILELAPIPPNARVTEIVLDANDLDTHETPTIALDVGIMSGEWGDPAGTRTVGAEFLAASTIARTGGVARPTTAAAYRTGRSGVARSIGVKLQTAAATIAAGTIGLTVTYTG